MRTVGGDAVVAILDGGKEMRPAREVGKVEIQVVRLGQRIEVGGIEFEDVEGVEGADGGHGEC